MNNRLDRQKVFTVAKDHLLLQGCAAMSESGTTCMYRAKNGHKCAIGAIITDEHYSPEMESSVVSNWLVLEAVQKSLGMDDSVPLDHDDVAFLESLQGVHDRNNEHPELFENALRSFAKQYNLVY